MGSWLSTPKGHSWQPSSKGDELISKLTNYLEDCSLSSSSSSGLNTSFVLMNSQNNELWNQNMELCNQVNHYKIEVNCLEKKLDMFRKKADTSDLMVQLLITQLLLGHHQFQRSHSACQHCPPLRGPLVRATLHPMLPGHNLIQNKLVSKLN